jgi:hypothetical protein
MQFWWGASPSLVGLWRRTFAVDRRNNPGSQRPIHVAVNKAADAQRGVTPPAQQAEARGNSQEGIWPCHHGALWWPEEVALLGTMADE